MIDVGDDVALEEGAQHAHLRDRLVAAAGEHERGARSARPRRCRSWLIGAGTERSDSLAMRSILASYRRSTARFADRGKAGAMLRPKSNPPHRRLIPARGREAHA